jgi:hypothetical protein
MIICRDWSVSKWDPDNLVRLDLADDRRTMLLVCRHTYHWYWGVDIDNGTGIECFEGSWERSCNEAKRDADNAARELGYLLLTKDEEEKAMLLI